MNKNDLEPRTGATSSGGSKPPPDAKKRSGGVVRRSGGQNEEEPPVDATATPSLFVTIDYFCHMLGLKDRTFYYRHKDDPGFPQLVPVGDGHRKRLVRKECEDFIAGLIEKRDAAQEKGG